MLRGEVWLMSLDRNIKHPENSSRMVIILSSDALAVLPLRVIVPLAAWKDSYESAPWLVRVPPVLGSGVENVMVADALQVRSISNSRLKKKLGDLPERLINEIATAVGLILSSGISDS